MNDISVSLTGIDRLTDCRLNGAATISGMAILYVLPLLAVASAISQLPSKPHLVFVLADDVGFGDVGYVDPAVISPTIDSLATSGIRLGRAYSYCWCAPSRAALMTGRLPPNNGVYSGPSGAYFALSEKYRLLPQFLSEAGYVSHAVGKWHLGSYAKRFLPENRGFETYFGYLNGGEDYFHHDNLAPGTNRSGARALLADEKEEEAAGCQKYRDLWDSTTAEGPAIDPTYFPRYSTSLFAEKAVDIIRNHSKQHLPSSSSLGEPGTVPPLFLYLPFQAAHTPFQVPEEFQMQYAWYKPCQLFRGPTGTYGENKNYVCAKPAHGLSGAGTKHCACNRMVIAAQVTALDSAVASITQALEDVGMWDNTVFVFSGDNGGPESEAHWNGGLRGGKWDNWEGGIRPASFVASPLLPPSVRGGWMNSTLHLVDWSATFMRLAGLDPKNEPTLLDGVDQWPALSGEVAAGTELRNHTLVSIYTSPPHNITAGVGILLSGRYKVATMPLSIYGEGGSEMPGVDCQSVRPHCWSADCLLGTGGGWLKRTAGDAGAVAMNRNQCPSVDCNSPNLSSVDSWLCDPSSCSVEQPCLWDVVTDPQERNNLGRDPAFAHIAASLVSILRSLNSSVIPPYQAVQDSGGEMCRAFKGRNTTWPYFGPWKD